MEKNGDDTGKVHPDLGILKKMCRLLEFKRRQFFVNDWKNCSRAISLAQFNHLMLVRFSMPCNLGAIMRITGLTSAGASLFVDKLVNEGILMRQEDPGDRRNIVVSVTEEGQKFLNGIDERLDDFICNYYAECTDEDLKVVAAAMDIVCSKLEK